MPDNLKQGVTHPSRYEPDLNPTYQEFAEHYGVAVIPARSVDPKDKAKVEVGVKVVERWILARLRNRTCIVSRSQPGDRRTAQRSQRSRDGTFANSRRQLFEELDQPVLHPLPQEPYEYATWKNARVNIDYHVELEKHFYSVPYELIHQEIRIRATEHMLEIFHQGKVVAAHPRSQVAGRYSTQTAHMPEKHQKAGEWTPERLLHWAESYGPQTHQLVRSILLSRRHPEQAFRSCLGILHLSKQYPPAQVEHACQIAYEEKSLNYQAVKTLLDLIPPILNPRRCPPMKIPRPFYYQ